MPHRILLGLLAITVFTAVVFVTTRHQIDGVDTVEESTDTHDGSAQAAVPTPPELVMQNATSTDTQPAEVFDAPMPIEQGEDVVSVAPVALTEDEPVNTETEVVASQEVRSFYDSFDAPYTVSEAGQLRASMDQNWWVSSGGYFYSKNGVGSTVSGALSSDDHWFKRYKTSNPRDTDGGIHPQNIFRLVQKDRWADYEQQAYFRITDVHLSESEYRNGSNGLLFFNRYQDQYNLYYTGIRADGYVTIKKKVDNVYYDLAYEPFMAITEPYDRDTNPNLLPEGSWIGLKSRVVTNGDGTVTITVYVDRDRTGEWEQVTKATDDGVRYGGAVYTEGHTGIRTDFMDVEFDDYRVTEL